MEEDDTERFFRSCIRTDISQSCLEESNRYNFSPYIKREERFFEKLGKRIDQEED